jgi:signal transduction histidine kinase/CheY-like chemotaxis protein
VVIDIAAGGNPRVVSLNREACRLFGLDPVAAPGGELDELPLNADYRRLFDELLERWRSSGGTYASEIRLPANRLVLETTVIGFGPAAAARQKVCVLIADVTKRRIIDQEMTQARRVRALGELVGGIAREFNNLLMPILAIANMLKLEHPDNPSLVDNLGLIEKASLQAKELTQRLLTFGRRSGNQADLVALSEVVANCFALIQQTIDRRIELRSEVPETLSPVVINPTDLNQILFNLIVNSRDALVEKLARPGGGEWTPRLVIRGIELPPGDADGRPKSGGGDGAGGRIQITIEDNGDGIAPEIIDRVFDPFFTTKEVGKGAGLGLATVWHLVTEAGGQVRVESTLGQGTRFVVILPSHPNQPGRPARAVPEAAPKRAMSGTVSFVVEDNRLVARAIVAILERLGSRVTVAQDGEAAWKAFSADPGAFALLLVDVNLPKMNGIDFVRLVRGTPFSGRIIMMSGNLTSDEVSTLRQLRVDRILAKPFTVDELSAVLN